MLLKLRTNRHAMEDRADPLLDRVERLAKEVRRDAHKMHAFVRFREIEAQDGTRFVAWFEPDNHIVRREAGFFVRRFANMRWSILTPELTIHWDGQTLTEGPGAIRWFKRNCERRLSHDALLLTSLADRVSAMDADPTICLHLNERLFEKLAQN